MDQNIIIPLFGMATGIIIPIAVFIWKYHEGKGQRILDELVDINTGYEGF